MKKLLFFIATAIAFASCGSDDCDHMATNDTSSNNSIVGSWYEESENEEIRYHENGKFYDKYCTIKRSGETEGTYEYNSNTNKLTWTYSFAGQTQMSDWTVNSLTDFSMTIYSSTVAEHKMEKIVESYTLNVGETASLQFSQVYPSYTVSSYTSLSPSIASVTNDGAITAEGEKGTAYIKISTNAGNVWAKVIVGDDCADLWYDFPSLMGTSYSEIKNILGTPSTSGSDGYSYAFDISTYHDIVGEIDIFLNTSTGKTEQIGLALKSSAPESQILSYLNSHYYKYSELGDNYYLTGQTKESSRALVVYDKTNNAIWFCEPTYFDVKDLWKDYTADFGATSDELKAKYGTPYYESEKSVYFTPTNDYLSLVAFSLNTSTKKVYAVSAFTKEGVNTQTVLNFLQSKYYTYEKETDTSNNYYAFLNATTLSESTIGVTYDVTKGLISYVDLTAN